MFRPLRPSVPGSTATLTLSRGYKAKVRTQSHGEFARLQAVEFPLRLWYLDDEAQRVYETWVRKVVLPYVTVKINQRVLAQLRHKMAMDGVTLSEDNKLVWVAYIIMASVEDFARVAERLKPRVG
jgi:hypothetical protein